MEAAETRPPLTAAGRPAARFVRHVRRAERSPGNMWGCVSVIGLHPMPSASLYGVVGCVVALRATHCLQTVCAALRVAIEVRRVLLVGCCVCKLRENCNMSQRHCRHLRGDPSDSEGSSTSSDFHRDNLPRPDVVRARMRANAGHRPILRRSPGAQSASPWVGQACTGAYTAPVPSRCPTGPLPEGG